MLPDVVSFRMLVLLTLLLLLLACLMEMSVSSPQFTLLFTAFLFLLSIPLHTLFRCDFLLRKT
jgi:hypothetical protein